MKQKSFLNLKGAGRPAKHDKGVRHTEREAITKMSALHLTIKIEKNKAGLRSKAVLSLLHKAIKRARVVGLGIVHYTLEHDHIHMLVEAEDNVALGRGMQSFGICFSKGINKLKNASGQVYKSRYHLRILKTPSEVKNVINYILNNSVKHKASSFVNTFNSLVASRNLDQLYPGFEIMIEDTIERSFTLRTLRTKLKEVLAPPESYLVKSFA